MKKGNKIRVFESFGGTLDLTVEEFRHCLGVFVSETHREAGEFIPLCDLYEPGCDSKIEYISNFGEYTSNKVQGWMDLPT